MVGLAQDTHISLWPSSYSLQAWPRLQLAMIWQEIRRWQRISLFCPHIASNKAGSCKILAAGCTTNGNLPAQGMGPPQPPLRDTAVASYKAIALLLRPMVPRTLTSGRHDLPDNSLVIHCQVGALRQLIWWSWQLSDGQPKGFEDNVTTLRLQLLLLQLGSQTCRFANQLGVLLLQLPEPVLVELWSSSRHCAAWHHVTSVLSLMAMACK